MKVCLFGGTFDPPHLGHLQIAGFIRDELGIERILFIPAWIAPHKVSHQAAAAEHRLAMLRLAVQGRRGFEVSEMEIRRQDVSYSIDTIRQMKKDLALDSEDLFFLIGADSLLELPTWRLPEHILAESRVLVAVRPGFDTDKIPNNLRDSVELLTNPPIKISSSQIRRRVKTGQSIDDLVPDSVVTYIRQNDLYQD
jgi:nicotinate-nucleotide adenylyltransferase